MHNRNFEASLNELSISYIISYFNFSGIYFNHKYQMSDIYKTLNIQEKFIPFVNYMLSILEDTLFIKLDGESIYFIKNKDAIESTDAITKQIIKNYPDKKELVMLLNEIWNKYHDALSGQISAISVLYNDGNFSYLDPVISEMELFSEIDQIRIWLAKLTEQHSNKKNVIMEVGGGNGQLTWSLVSSVNDKCAKYYFTDISRYFILEAKKIASNNNIEFMDFHQFDITKDPEVQTIPLNSIDTLLAFNVVHIAKNIVESLKYLKKLLNTNGQIIIVEYTDLPIWLHTIWGFAEGWWHFSDEYRIRTPLMCRLKWEQALLQAGYKNINFFSNSKFDAKDYSLLGIIATV